MMSETGLEPVHVSCHYDVSPEIIFDAWTRPELISKWLFVGPTSEITNIEMDMQVEGKFSILELERKNGEYIDHFGVYKEIEQPLRLAFTLSVPKHFTGETIVTIHIFPTLNGCELKLTQEGVSKEITEKNWLEMLHQLKHAVEVKGES